MNQLTVRPVFAVVLVGVLAVAAGYVGYQALSFNQSKRDIKTALADMSLPVYMKMTAETCSKAVVAACTFEYQFTHERSAALNDMQNSLLSAEYSTNIHFHRGALADLPLHNAAEGTNGQYAYTFSLRPDNPKAADYTTVTGRTLTINEVKK